MCENADHYQDLPPATWSDQSKSCLRFVFDIFRRNSFSMDNNQQPPETLENILRVTRTQDSVLNAYYTDANGEVVTMTLYDISETDPTDILGDDVLGSGTASRGSERRDSAAYDDTKRFHFRPQPSQGSGHLDPERIQEKLRKLSTLYADESDVSSEDNESSDNDFDASKTTPYDARVRL